MTAGRRLRVTVWNEYVHERGEESVKRIYPDGMHRPIADGIRRELGDGVSVRIATLEEPEHGLTEEALAEIGRVLCRGGRLALQTALRPARTSLLFRALERSIRFGSFEEGELREMLRGQRLEVLESERHGISCTLLARKAA